MSKLEKLATANNWDADKLREKFDYAFSVVDTTIETGVLNTSKVAIEQAISAAHDVAGECLNANDKDRASKIESVIDVAIERTKRSKLNRAAKLIKLAILILYLAGIRTAEEIEKRFTRQNVGALIDRGLLMLPCWEFISRVYEAGISCKLSVVREQYRKAFDTDWKAGDVKKALVESMLGFVLTDRAFVLFFAGENVEREAPNGDKYTVHIQSALEQFESALSADRENQKNITSGLAEAQAPKFKLSADAIKTANDAILIRLEAEAKAEREAKEKAEAEAKADAERKADAEAKAEAKRKAEAKAEQDKLKAEAEAEAKRKAEAEAKRKAEQAEADRKSALNPKKAKKADAERKAEAEAKRKADAEAKETVKDVRELNVRPARGDKKANAA